jgi:hypothetical protein
LYHIRAEKSRENANIFEGADDGTRKNTEGKSMNKYSINGAYITPQFRGANNCKKP